MEKIEIPMNRVLELYKFVSVGKLMAGLVHNMNGPLHSLGIEMDVINFLMDKGIESFPEFIENLKKRLTRMEEEFEKLNWLIRSTSERIELASFPYQKMDLNRIVQREIEFLAANLYFKHKVEKHLELSPDIHPFGNLPEDTFLGLQWFIQGLVEEIEKQEIKELIVRTSLKNGKPFLEFDLGDPGISEGFLKSDTDLGLSLALLLLNTAGIEISANKTSPKNRISLCFPKL